MLTQVGKVLYRDLLLLCGLLFLTLNGTAQNRFESGPYEGFLKEEPELNKIELPKPLSVSVVKGIVVYSGDRPLSDAVFEVRDRNGKVFSATTDVRGAFRIAGVPPGTYALKVTKNQFHSVVGTIIVSSKVSPRKSIRVQLQLGT